MGHTKHHMKHKHRAHGGRTIYSGAGSHVAHEAEEMKRGGHHHKHGGKVHGHKGHHRIHKKRGGGVGSDKHPFSSAYTKSSEAHK